MKTVLILCGGISSEHEISLISTKGILDAIDRTKFQTMVVGITKDGVWLLQDEKHFYTGDFRADKIKLNPAGRQVLLSPNVLPNKRGKLVSETKTLEFDVVFPLIHGPFGEGSLPGMLDVMGIPYVGAGNESSWVCMDKVLTKSVCEGEGIAVAPFLCVRSRDELSSRREQIEKLGLPLFVKAPRQGSSVSVSKVKHLDELPKAVESALQFDSKCLIEKAVNGREMEISVLGDFYNPKVSLPAEIVPSAKHGFYTYEAKYLDPDGAQLIVPAKIEKNYIKAIQDLALRVYRILEIEGMARIDVFLEASGKVVLNEANTIPGFTPISMYPKMWEASGLSYSELISELIESGLKRKRIF